MGAKRQSAMHDLAARVRARIRNASDQVQEALLNGTEFVTAIRQELQVEIRKASPESLTDPERICG